MGDREHIVVALDGDAKMSEHVIAWCAKMKILKENHKITFLHVAEYHTVSYVTAADLGAFASSSVTSPRINAAMKKLAVDKGSEFLQDCSRKASSHGIKPDELKLLIANQGTSVKSCIKNYLEKHNASAVVCGSRGIHLYAT
uniref:UspA domain-containing protein n=1 Tax=Lotharella globosa TaxID=91324 RepID=A0A7S4DU59_9EUKA